MSPRRPSDNERCTYCGSAEALTRDHIPPKCLFLKPRPNNLITVPACPQCNNGAKLDDEYFRVFLAVGKTVHASLIGRALWGATFESLKKPTKYRFVCALRKSVKKAKIQSEGGIFLEEGKVFEAKLARVIAVPRRIIRGLFFKNTGLMLPVTHRVRVFYEGDLASQKRLRDPRIESCLAPLADVPDHTVVERVFTYKYFRVRGREYESVWALCFLSEALFFGFTYSESTNGSPDISDGDTKSLPAH